MRFLSRRGAGSSQKEPENSAKGEGMNSDDKVNSMFNMILNTTRNTTQQDTQHKNQNASEGGQRGKEQRCCGPLHVKENLFLFSVLFFDDVDRLEVWTQTILYNFFDWANMATGRL
jgi:hypothetical protein